MHAVAVALQSEMASFSRSTDATPSSRERTRAMSSIDKLLVQGTFKCVAAVIRKYLILGFHHDHNMARGIIHDHIYVM